MEQQQENINEEQQPVKPIITEQPVITISPEKLEINDLQKATKKALIMDDITFTIHSGEIFALVGAPLSCKTLLSKVVVNLIKKTRGEVLVSGTPNKKTQVIARKVGISLEQQNFYPSLTAYKTLLQYARMHRYPVSNARIINTLNLVDLKKTMHYTIDRLSPSSIARLRIAVAIYGRPEIVILDDPFKNLTDIEAHKLRVVIKTIASVKNTAFLLTSQNVSAVEDICDTIGIIDDGFMIAIKSYNQFVRDDTPYTKIRVMTTTPNYAAKIIEENTKLKTFLCGEWVVVDTVPANAQKIADILYASDIKVLAMQRVNRSLSEQFYDIISSRKNKRDALERVDTEEKEAMLRKAAAAADAAGDAI